MLDIIVHEFDRVLVLSLNGEFSLESIKYTEDIWKKSLVKKPEAVAIDYKDVSFIDSSAIGLLIKLYNSASEAGIPLIFTGLSKRLVHVFEIARLDSLFTIMDIQDFEKKYISS